MLSSCSHAIGLVILPCTLYRPKIPHLTLRFGGIGLRNRSAVQIAPLSRWNRTNSDSARLNPLSLTACTAASGSQQKQFAQRLRYPLRTSVVQYGSCRCLGALWKIYLRPPLSKIFSLLPPPTYVPERVLSAPTPSVPAKTPKTTTKSTADIANMVSYAEEVLSDTPC